MVAKATIWILILFYFVQLPIKARAQDKPGSKSNDISSSRQQNISAADVVHIQLQRPAIQGELSLSLNRAVELALERNPLLTVEKIRLEQAREKIDEEKGYYDPLFNLRGNVARRDNVVASRFYPTGLYVESEQAPSVSIETRIYTGGRFTFGLDYKRLVSSSNTQTLSPQYSANFGLTFIHPLLRDFGWGVNTTRIRVAQKGEEVAEHNFFQKISQLIQQVEEGYWTLVFMRHELEGRKKSLKVARGLLKRNEDLVRAGRVAAVSILEARAGVATREEGVIAAENEVKKFEDRLKLLLRMDLAKAAVTPVDFPEEAEVDLNTYKSVDMAFQQRPEIQATQKELEQRHLELNFAANQTLPRLDFSVQYGMSGISGSPNPTCVDPTAAVCVPVGNSVGGSVFAGETNARDAFNRMFSRHPFDNWSVELKLQIPLWNRTASAQHSAAKLRLLETTERLRAMRDQVEAEVRHAIRETLTARKRIDASRETVKFLEDQLGGTGRRLEAGLASSYDVLQVLDDLDRARTSERKAIMEFNVGQSKVRLAEASNLERYHIELKKPSRFVFQAVNAGP
jgi:outer membrane protein